MKSIRKTKIFLAALLISVTTASLSVPVTSIAASANAAQAGREKGTILMKVKPNATQAQLKELDEVMRKQGLKLHKKIIDGRVQVLKVKDKDQQLSEEQLAEKLRQTGAVEFAEPNYDAPLAVNPNDPLFADQWHHNRIQSPAAWDISPGSSATLVAVCDSGFTTAHPDLAPNLLLPGLNIVDGSTNVEPTPGGQSEIIDHGTQTAGVIAAAGNNSVGVAGVMWRAKVLPIKVSNSTNGGSTYEIIANCITTAANRGAKVVNVSYDGLYASATLNDAGIYLRSKGSVLVVAAGNSFQDISFWGASPNMLVVGATDRNNGLAYFSNYGTPVDMVAPGVDIYTTVSESLFGAPYGAVSGTSFSTPMVAGSAALLYSINPSITPAQVDDALLSTTSDLGTAGPDLYFANGLLNLFAAASKVRPPTNIILDTLNVGQMDATRSFVGTWCASGVAPYYGIASLYGCSPGLDSYRFTPTIPQSGTYRVYVQYTSHPNRGTAVPVQIQHRGGVATSFVDMRTGGSSFVLMGTFSLAAGTSSYLQVDDSKGLASIDAVRFEFVSGDVVQPLPNIVLDNLAAGQQDENRSFVGTWCLSGVAPYYGNYSLYGCSPGLDSYRFTPTITRAGNYRVYVQYTSHPNRSSTVPVKVQHTGGLSTTIVNMQTGGGQFVLLGTYNLATGSTSFLEVDDSRGTAAIDAARFEFIP